MFHKNLKPAEDLQNQYRTFIDNTTAEFIERFPYACKVEIESDTCALVTAIVFGKEDFSGLKNYLTVPHTTHSLSLFCRTHGLVMAVPDQKDPLYENEAYKNNIFWLS